LRTCERKEIRISAKLPIASIFFLSVFISFHFLSIGDHSMETYFFRLWHWAAFWWWDVIIRPTKLFLV
jgi:hypothetical protein